MLINVTFVQMLGILLKMPLIQVVFFNAYQNLPNLPCHAHYFPYME